MNLGKTSALQMALYFMTGFSVVLALIYKTPLHWLMAGLIFALLVYVEFFRRMP